MFLWKYRKQIRQTWRCFNFKHPKSFGSNWENNDNLFFFKNSSFSQIILVDRNNAIPTDLFHILAGMWKNFCSNLTKRKKFLNILSWKYSCGELEFSFDNHADAFPQKQQKLSVQCPKTEKKQLAFLKNLGFFKWLLWARTKQFRRIRSLF